jgi:DHA1 family bicyclomycin/chloramphenicol resistance-like MFS transporter
LRETQFSWLFVSAIVGVTLGAFLSGRLAGRFSPYSTVTIGYAIIFIGVAFNLIYCATVPASVPWSVIPIMVYAFGMSLAMPSITLLALELFPLNRGLASSLLGFEHSLLSGIVAGVVVPFLSHSAVTSPPAWQSWRVWAGGPGCCLFCSAAGDAHLHNGPKHSTASAMRRRPA